MRYYIIAGEASGDLHASNLISALKELDSKAEFRGWGGDRMMNNGAVIVKHYRDLAFMGFAEVISNLKTILSNLSYCKKDILEYKPDAVILIDYPGFNLRIASFLHKQGIKVIYYISPQVWAWKKSRVKIIKKVVDKLLVILPFEKEFFRMHGVEAEFTGHPLLDAISETASSVAFKEKQKRVVALLPGSRKQEIKKVLPLMLSVIPDFKDVTFIIAGVNSIPKSFYQEIIQDNPIEIEFNNTYKLLMKSNAALVTSGTATLETALFDVPEVVCYKGSWLSYTIARQLVKVKYISLVNLIMDRPVVKELIQSDLNKKNLKRELDQLLGNTEYKNQMLLEFNDLKEMLGGIGASHRAAMSINQFLTAKENIH